MAARRRLAAAAEKLAVALYRAGKYHRAIHELETSPGNAGEQVTGLELFVAALAHYRLGQTAKARAALLQAKAARKRALPWVDARRGKEVLEMKAEVEKEVRLPKDSTPPPAGPSCHINFFTGRLRRPARYVWLEGGAARCTSARRTWSRR